MKILLLGEYSNVHNTLAKGLRELGHEVTVASNGDFWKDYPRDQDLARRPGKLGGLSLMARVACRLPQWRGYDVVQLINPMFLELKAERILPVYRYLRRHNRNMVLCAMGLDWYWVHECVMRKPLRYSDFNIGDEVRTDPIAQRDIEDWIGTPTADGGWTGTPKGRLTQLIAHDCDAIVTGLYEYDVCYRPHFPEKTQFIPLPIHPTGPTNSSPSSLAPGPSPIGEGSICPANGEVTTPLSNRRGAGGEAGPGRPEPLSLFIGISRGRSVYKGTDVMLRAAEDVQREHPDRLKVVKAEGLPFDEYQRLMDNSDVIMDQLYAYTPAMNALLAMSKGIVVMGGGEPENYAILGERELRPIINVQPTYESVRHELEQLMAHADRLPQLKADSREYVRRHHDYLKVARQYEQLYRRL